jgi:Adaptor complexes medium subunit family
MLRILTTLWISYRYQKWESDKILSFVPPDGHFSLMSYRLVAGAATAFLQTIISLGRLTQYRISSTQGQLATTTTFTTSSQTSVL